MGENSTNGHLDFDSTNYSAAFSRTCCSWSTTLLNSRLFSFGIVLYVLGITQLSWCEVFPLYSLWTVFQGIGTSHVWDHRLIASHQLPASASNSQHELLTWLFQQTSARVQDILQPATIKQKPHRSSHWKLVYCQHGNSNSIPSFWSAGRSVAHLTSHQNAITAEDITAGNTTRLSSPEGSKRGGADFSVLHHLQRQTCSSQVNIKMFNVRSLT